MLHETHLPDTDITHNFDDRHNTNTLVHVNDDNLDGILLESTAVETDALHWFWITSALPQRRINNGALQCVRQYYAKSKGTSQSCWCLKYPWRERFSCGGGTRQDYFHGESQHRLWETTTKRDTIIWVSCWESAQSICLVVGFLSVLSYVHIWVNASFIDSKQLLKLSENPAISKHRGIMCYQCIVPVSCWRPPDFHFIWGCVPFCHFLKSSH